MTGSRCSAAAASVFLLLAGAPAAVAAPAVSDLPKGADVLQGTIEAISPAARTLVLRSADGSRQTIHYGADTVVFTGAAAGAPEVVPGVEAVVRCRRLVAGAGGETPDLCPVQMFADRVYLAAY